MSGRWINVAEKDCSACNGAGVESPELLRYRSKRSLFADGYRCKRCKGTGKESVGYRDLRDASGR